MEHTFPSETVYVKQYAVGGGWTRFFNVRATGALAAMCGTVRPELFTGAVRDCSGSSTAIHPGCHRWDSKTEIWQ